MTIATLKGTEKQIAYAESRRSLLLSQVDYAAEYYKERIANFSDTAQAELMSAYVMLVEELFANDSSAFWLDTFPASQDPYKAIATHIVKTAKERGLVPTMVKEIEAQRAARN